MKLTYKIAFISTVLLSLLVCSIQVSATSVEADYSNIVDYSEVFSAEEFATLNQIAEDITQQYGLTVHIITSTDTDAISDSLYTYTEDVYTAENLWRDDYSRGFALILDTNEGQYHRREFTSYEMSQASYDSLFDAFYIGMLTMGDFYEFSLLYLEELERDLAAYAQQQAAQKEAYDSLVVANVMDTADILTDSEEQILTQQAQLLEEEHGIAVYILTVDNYAALTTQSDIYYFSTDFYTEHNLGHGTERDGVMLTLSMSDRDYSYISYGPTAEDTFPNSVKIDVEDDFLYHFSSNDWFAGFQAFIDSTEHKIEYGWLDVLISVSVEIAASAVIALIIAFVIVNYYKNQLKSVKMGGSTNSYIPQGGINITHSSDDFTHTTTTRTKIVKSSGGGGGGGGRSFSGGGFSGRSGKF